MVSGKESTFLGCESTFLGIKTTLFGRNLKKLHFFVVGSWVGVLSVVSRSSLGGIRQGIREGKEMAILIKVLFYIREFFGRSLVLISPKGSNDYSVFGFSLVFYTEYIYKVQGKWILIFVLISGRPIGYCLVFRGKKFLANLHRQKNNLTIS